MLRPSCAPNWTLGDCMPEASIAQDPVVGGCGSSLDSRFRIRGQTPVFEIWGFSSSRTADPEDGGPRYANRFALSNPRANWQSLTRSDAWGGKKM
jgi:hypothetical protein